MEANPEKRGKKRGTSINGSPRSIPFNLGIGRMPYDHRCETPNEDTPALRRRGSTGCAVYIDKEFGASVHNVTLTRVESNGTSATRPSTSGQPSIWRLAGRQRKSDDRNGACNCSDQYGDGDDNDGVDGASSGSTRCPAAALERVQGQQRMRVRTTTCCSVPSGLDGDGNDENPRPSPSDDLHARRR